MGAREEISVGVVVRKRRIGHPWKEWAWEAVGAIPGAETGVSWRMMREEPDLTLYHAATLPLTLHAADTDSYLGNLTSVTPALYVVLRATEDAASPPVTPCLVTVSPFEAEGYLDSGEEAVERLPMPPALLEIVRAFVAAHHREEPFVKRQRDKARADGHDSGKGDPRIRQASDVYRPPGPDKRRPH